MNKIITKGMKLLLRYWLLNKIHDEQLLLLTEKYLKNRLLDIGCGTRSFKDLLDPYVTEHIGVDQEGTLYDKSNVDLFGTAYQIPVEDASFDSAICIAALEHLEERELALHECYRVLKPGGVAIYSVPFIWHLH